MAMKTSVSVLLVLGVSLSMGFLGVASARSASPGAPIASAASTAPSPSWWGKAAALASVATADNLAASSRSTVSVGPNVDVSDEPGPQSETSIAINAENPKEIVAGSNEIFRLPMRA